MKNFIAIYMLLVVSVSHGAIIEVGNGNHTSFGDCTIGCMASYSQAYNDSYFSVGKQQIDSLTMYGGQAAYGVYDVYVGYIADYSAGNLVSNAFNLSSFGSVDLGSIGADNKLVVDLGFTYDSLIGDLYINFTRTSASSYGNFAASSSYLWSRAYTWSNSASAVNGSNGYALNTTFTTSTYTPNAVSEPSIIALMGLGLFGLSLSRRKLK